MLPQEDLPYGCHVSGNTRLNHGKEQAPALHQCGKTDVETRQTVAAPVDLGKRLLYQNELVTHLLPLSVDS